MQCTKMFVFLSCAALAIAVPARAAEDAFHTGPYAGFGLGASNLDVASSPSTISRSVDTGALKIYGGYQFSNNFGAELGYVRTGHIKVSELINDVDVTRTVKTRAAYAVATGRLPISNDFSLSARIGMSYGDVNVGDSAPIPNTVEGSRKGVMIGAGAQYKLSQRYALSLDYDHIGKESKRVSADMLTMTLMRSF